VFLRPKVLSETAQESGDKRRRLCQGDANVTLLRAAQEAKRDEIAAERSRELQAFYCEWCCKQYASVSEWEVHLQSYAHVHTKNMKELRAAEASRRNLMRGSADEKRTKEARREERELAKRMKAAGVPTHDKPQSSRQETVVSTKPEIQESGEAICGSGALPSGAGERGSWSSIEEKAGFIGQKNGPELAAANNAKKLKPIKFGFGLKKR